MKRNQIIEAMQMLPKHCDFDFAIMPTGKAVEALSFMCCFVALANINLYMDYDADECWGALIDIFTKLGMQDEACDQMMRVRCQYETRAKALDDVAMRDLAKLAMRDE